MIQVGEVVDDSLTEQKNGILRVAQIFGQVSQFGFSATKSDPQNFLCRLIDGKSFFEQVEFEPLPLKPELPI